MAEARIVIQDNINPILTKDFISTSVWEPGYSVPVALAGFFDLDGDGNSDLQRLISNIQQNGGNVVAYHDEEGTVVGEIDEYTRYFVTGDEPKSEQFRFENCSIQWVSTLKPKSSDSTTSDNASSHANPELPTEARLTKTNSSMIFR